MPKFQATSFTFNVDKQWNFLYYFYKRDSEIEFQPL